MLRMTKAGVAVVLLTVGLYAATLSATMPVLYLAVALLVAGLALNLLLAWTATRGLTVTREAPTHVCERREFFVTVTVDNPTWFGRHALVLRDEGLAGEAGGVLFVPELPARSRRTVTYRARARRRGVHELRHCVLETAFPFGLFTVRRRLVAASTVVAYPFYYEITDEMISAASGQAGTEATAPFTSGSGGNIYGIREYRPGDPLRHVHWASTAKTGELMVRQFEHDVMTSVAVLLDTSARSIAGPEEDSNLETAIRAAASVAHHALTRDFPVALVLGVGEQPAPVSVRTRGDPTPVFDALARATPWAGPGTDAFLRGAGRLEPAAGTVIAILLDVTAEALGEVMNLRCAGREIHLFLVDRDSFAGRGGAPLAQEVAEALVFCQARGVRVAWLRRGDDITECVRASVRDIAHLRFALGAR